MQDRERLSPPGGGRKDSQSGHNMKPEIGPPSLRDIAEENIGLAKKATNYIWKYKWAKRRFNTIDDVYAESIVGLMKVLQRTDFSLDKWPSYVFYSVLGHLRVRGYNLIYPLRPPVHHQHKHNESAKKRKTSDKVLEISKRILTNSIAIIPLHSKTNSDGVENLEATINGRERSPLEIASQRDQDSLIMKKIRELRPHIEKAILLYYGLGGHKKHTFKQIAKMEGISISATRDRIVSGRSKLKESLQCLKTSNS